MIRLGSIDFDDGILDALRDDKLVVFAGAGVSVGAPSKLPDFRGLASSIAFGTGLVPKEPLDRFLGQLDHKGVAVHERAAQLLSRPESRPTALHHDLLRLFRSVDRIRLVTTNFDHHFETAAEAVFGRQPEVYRAPALPLGREFRGIVHVHGSLHRPKEMVLTDADFGRAYLTEGWARRFLVELFGTYTVLFVGYSHNDVVMTYLARALPATRGGRYALTDKGGNWHLLGIKPIRFNKGTDDDAYKELYEGVQRLAERATRGVLDWQTRLAEMGSRLPPADAEAIGEVEQALLDVHTTRFLTNVARDAEWPRWLNARKILDALFGIAELSERDKLLASWLAENFVIEHPDVMFDLIAVHGMRLNAAFWYDIAREIGTAIEKVIEESALERWITILLACVPPQAGDHVFMWLAERCAAQGAVHLTLRVFLAMSEHRLNIKPGFVWHDKEGGEHGQRLDADCPLRADHWSLNEVWTKHLKPHLASVAQPLLSGISRRFEEIHQDLMAWGKASRNWDSVSFRRSAIEPHEQNRYPEDIDVLIDAARDALEWLANNSPTLLEAWIERLVQSDVPMLRRLSIHAVAVHPGKSADERLNWLLNRVGLHSPAEHHEVYRLVALAYPVASLGARRAVIDAVLAHRLPARDEWSAEKRTARSHFNWLSWLLQAKPECPLVEAALAPIKAEYPEWLPSDHPDFTHWIGPAEWVGHQSPWSVDQLLAREPREQLDHLLTFKGHGLDGPDRDGLIEVIRDACKQKIGWAFALADVLVERSLWSSDLWPAVIQGWQEAELTVDDWRAVLATIAKPELHAAQAYDVASLLYSIVRDEGKPFALDILEQANAVALSVWQDLETNESYEDTDDWLTLATNRPAGVIVEFWLNGLSLLMRGKSGSDRTLPDNYRQWFEMVVQDPTTRGGLGRTLLASQTAFLFELDEAWARKNVVPLFSDLDRKKFSQAWDGFLVWGRLYPVLVDALMPAFISAVARLDADFLDRRQRFIEFYTALSVFHVADPTEKLLPALFQHGSVQDWIRFATHLGYFLRHMQPAAKQQLWERWLLRYWRNRLQGVPAPLDEAEVREMLEWLPHVGDSFPEAVSLAVRSPEIRIEHSLLLYELADSDLVTRYPTETAELLIYLCNCAVSYLAEYLVRVAVRLPALAPELRLRLDEGLARAGCKVDVGPSEWSLR